VHSVTEAEATAAHAAMDYLIFGTMFATTSKDAGVPIQPLAALTEASQRASAPVWAIGGITPVTAVACLAAGATGIAAIGAFLDGGPDVALIGARVVAMRRAVAGHFGKQVQ
jgi:thiamine-phosphate pyrophosphorylase